MAVDTPNDAVPAVTSVSGQCSDTVPWLGVLAPPDPRQCRGGGQPGQRPRAPAGRPDNARG